MGPVWGGVGRHHRIHLIPVMSISVRGRSGFLLCGRLYIPKHLSWLVPTRRVLHYECELMNGTIPTQFEPPLYPLDHESTINPCEDIAGGGETCLSYHDEEWIDD